MNKFCQYICCATLCILPNAHALAQNSAVFDVPAIPMTQGIQLEFNAQSVIHPLRPPVQENFKLTIREIWDNGIAFQYEVTQSTLGNEQGFQSLSSLDTCSTIDPWWEPTKSDYDDRCEFWIPKRVFQELETNGKSYLSVDTVARRDAVVRWETQNHTHFLCHLDGKPILLKAIRVKTSRDDEFIILNDPHNPLILSAKSMFFSWQLQKILTKN